VDRDAAEGSASNTDALRRTLLRIDGRGYKAYRDIRGAFGDSNAGDTTLFIDHVQGDPFATPSKLRVRIARPDASIPPELFANRVRRVALEDFLARRVRQEVDAHRRERRGSGKSGTITVDAGGQQVLERSAVVVNDAFVELRVSVGLPAAGRRILGREAERLICDDLLRFARAGLTSPKADAQRFVECVENQEFLRDQLGAAGLVAFVADGSRLPRESGASDLPLASDTCVAFRTPDSLRVELPLLHPIEVDGRRRETLVGLGIRRGVTLVVGGGYHGKSTLLSAIQRAVYPHIPGDGREWVVAESGLVKIRAEDGRRVESVDIDCFISGLPGGRDTRAFTSDDASGSTSQAANIVESVEVGASGLLLDEDTSATNFMVRDARMQALIAAADEPITPFVDRVRELYETLGISTVLVMGGCGDYFGVADSVIAMREFLPEDASVDAKRIAAEVGSARSPSRIDPLRAPVDRVPVVASFDASRGRRDVKIDTRGTEQIRFGRHDIDLRALEQLVDPSQTRAIGYAIQLAVERFADGASLREILDSLDALFDRSGLDELDPFHRPGQHPGNFARPRRFEVAAAINRLRTLKMQQRR
jgi:predicted ABC-class ATPase